MSSWFGRFSFFETPKKPAPASLPELVLLLAAPLPFTVEFLQGAAVAAFGKVLPTDEPDAEEFVTGEYPIFFVQFKRQLLQVKSMFLPYFDPEVRPFVSGDPAGLLPSIRDPDFRKAVAAHKGWISVALMNPAVVPEGKDAYRLVSKLLSAFGFEEIVALLCPPREIVMPWDFDMQEILAKGKGSSFLQR